MKTKALIGAIAAWAILSSILIIPLVSGCSNIRKSNIVEDLSDDGQLLNDDLVAYRSGDGKVSIKNSVTGEVTIKDLQIDWTQRSRNDSIAVFCSEGKRGYYNAYTGEIVVPAQYRRAWIFSDGLAAVQKNGNIGFIDHQGRVVIDFLFPFHGNPLSDFVFEDGHCVVADNNGKCGVIDTKGRWLIKPDYEYVTACRDYAIVTNSGAKMQVGYDGHIINSFVIDYLRELTYTCQERSVTPDGSVCYIDKTVSTGLFSYSVGGRCGLMDSNCNRLTEPIYTYLNAENDKVLKATLLDGTSDVIINTKGEVMK